MRPNCMSLQINSHWLDAVASAERDRSYLRGGQSCQLGPEVPLHSFLCQPIPLSMWKGKHQLPCGGQLHPALCCLLLWQGPPVPCPFGNGQQGCVPAEGIRDADVWLCSDDCVERKWLWGSPALAISCILLLTQSRKMFVLAKLWDLFEVWIRLQAESLMEQNYIRNIINMLWRICVFIQKWNVLW